MDALRWDAENLRAQDQPDWSWNLGLPHNIATDTNVEQEGEATTVIGFVSNMHLDAAGAGKNFLTPAIHQLVLRQLTQWGRDLA
jgi:hypothetical protein